MTSRRTALAGLLILSFATAASAQFELPTIKRPRLDIPTTIKPPKKETEKEGPQTVECPKFESVKAQQQENVWCWAACAEMVYRYHKKATEQKEIAARIHGYNEKGAAQVRAASLYEIMVALAEVTGKSDRMDRFVDRFVEAWEKNPNKGVTFNAGQYIGAWLAEDAADTDDMIEHLKRKEPVVVGMARDARFEGGHAMVIYGATYKLGDTSGLKRVLDPNDKEGLSKSMGVRRYEIVSVKVMDPWMGEPREISGEDLAKDVDFLMSQKRAKAIIKKEDESVR